MHKAFQPNLVGKLIIFTVEDQLLSLEGFQNLPDDGSPAVLWDYHQSLETYVFMFFKSLYEA